MKKYILVMLIGLFAASTNADMFSSIRTNGYKVVMLASNQTLENVIYSAIGNGVVTNKGITINGIPLGNGTSITIVEATPITSFSTNSYYATNSGVIVGSQSNDILQLLSHASNQSNVNNSVANSLSLFTNTINAISSTGNTALVIAIWTSNSVIDASNRINELNVFASNQTNINNDVMAGIVDLTNITVKITDSQYLNAITNYQDAILSGLTITNGGSLVGSTKVTQTNYSYTLLNTAPEGGYGEYAGVASSIDGTKLVIVERYGGIYTSTDSGANWTQHWDLEDVKSWNGVASSSDGTKLAAVSEEGYVYTSTDSGTNWTLRTTMGQLMSVSSSYDGTKLVVTEYGGHIYTSTDAGTNWTARSPWDKEHGNWWASASSADGTKLVVAEHDGVIYGSTDSGVNWEQRSDVGSRHWTGVASSADGTKLVAVAGGFGGPDYIFCSTDNGYFGLGSFRGDYKAWQAVACSADGMRLVALEYPGYVHTSDDFGTNWVARNPNKYWKAVASSADGTKLVATTEEPEAYAMTLDYIQTATPIKSIGDITPYTSNSYDIGSTNLLFRSGYFSNLNSTIIRASNVIQTTGGWDDLVFPANSIYAVGLQDIVFNGTNNSLQFKSTCNTNFASDNVWVVGQLPHGINTNSAFISPHIHFLQESASQTNMFFVRYKRYKLGEAITNTWTDLGWYSNKFSYTSGIIHQLAEGVDIVGPFGISEIIDFKIWGRGGVSVYLKQFDVHYQRDSFGSDNEYSKGF